MINEKVTLLSDSDFLTFARLYGRGDMLLNDYIELRDYVRKRCDSLGYTWEQGCCGVNKITRSM